MAPAVIRLFLPADWIPSIPFWIVYCLANLLIPIHTANLEALKAIGRTDLYLRLEILKKALGLSIVVGTLLLVPDKLLSFRMAGIPMEVKSRVLAVALTGIPSAIVSSFVNAHPNKRLLGYSYREQIRDLLPAAGLGAVMFAAVWVTNYIPLPDGRLWLALLLLGQILLGAGLYVGLSVLFRADSFSYLWKLLRGMLTGRKKEGTDQ